MAGFLPGLLGGYQGYQLKMANAGSEEARRAIRYFYGLLAAEAIVPALLLFLPFCPLSGLAATHPALFRVIVVASTLLGSRRDHYTGARGAEVHGARS